MKTKLLQEQDWKCAICGKESDKWCLDHEHDTEMVRGVLCIPCNVGLGCFLDDPEILQDAIFYLMKHQQEPLGIFRKDPEKRRLRKLRRETIIREREELARKRIERSEALGIAVKQQRKEDHKGIKRLLNISEILSLKQQGLTHRAIGKIAGVSHMRISQIVAAEGLGGPRGRPPKEK